MALKKISAMIQAKKLLALKKIATLIQQTANPLTPFDDGNLRGSWFQQLSNGQNTLTVGYTADYAAKRHEVEAKKYTTKGTGTKFLERAVNQTKDEQLEILKRGLSV